MLEIEVLVFAPHNDDEVLGVGGSIAKFSMKGHNVYICEVTGQQDCIERQEAEQAHHVLGVKDTIYLNFPVVDLHNVSRKELNQSFHEIVQRMKPQIAFIPHKGDMHRDHFETAQAAMVALRPIVNPWLKIIYQYETLSESEWNIPSVDNTFIPTAWNDISEYYTQKVKAMHCYNSQLREFPHPRSLEAMQALAKLRGSTIGCQAAEAFSIIRQLM